MARTAEKYPGVLGEPLSSLDPDLERAGSNREKIIEVFTKRRLEVEAKLELLQRFFEIPEKWSERDRWHALSLFLAERHVPGFRTRAMAGAKLKWTSINRARLRIAVDRTAASHQKSITWACKKLAKQVPWSNIVKGKDPSESLRTQYKLADQAQVTWLTKIGMADFALTENQLRWEYELGKRVAG